MRDSVRDCSLEGQQDGSVSHASLIRKVISIAKVPGAIGPYGQAMLVNSTTYISGQLGTDLHVDSWCQEGWQKKLKKLLSA